VAVKAREPHVIGIFEEIAGETLLRDLVRVARRG
jgi:hypothetical protein